MSQFMGSIERIFIATKAGAPMEERSEVEAMPDQGLIGDRYFSNEGKWQKKGRRIGQDVTLIRLQALNNSGFEASETRRNLLINCDFELVRLVGKEFEIGEVRLLGVEDCTPCPRPSSLVGKKGFEKVFDGCGGLRAQILSPGMIRVGDSLRSRNVEEN